ncbi:MAG: Fis family transcriptional regulator [Pseudomonadota bacterium]|jgi:two-component system response regulator PilR (NtrC family)
MTNHTPHIPHILVIDDEPDLRTLYELSLLREGYRVDTAGDKQAALACLQQGKFDVIITDMRLPDGTGIEILDHLRKLQRTERSIVITAYGSADNAVESLKAGAFDYLTKPVDLKQFRKAISAAVQAPSAIAAMNCVANKNINININTNINTTTNSKTDNAKSHWGELALSRLVGESTSMRTLKERIVKVARSMAPVHIWGESGTGKELVATALHANSHRAGGAWVAVNCSAIPENLLESEFFGSKKGSFTGATSDREGFFQAAKGGTLFLDEIGDLPLAMQSKLLRAIQERSVRPVGSTQEVPVDARIVSATHKNLAEEVAEGRFRQDLFYRLNVIDLQIPPLRDRREDLPALCQALLERIAVESGMPSPRIAPEVLEPLFQLPLSGNVRELENLLHRAVALCDGTCLQAEDFHFPREECCTTPPPLCAELLPASASASALTLALPLDLQEHLDQQERAILIGALQSTGYNRTLAAGQLGLSLRQIRYRINRLKIDVPREDAGEE